MGRPERPPLELWKRRACPVSCASKASGVNPTDLDAKLLPGKRASAHTGSSSPL